MSQAKSDDGLVAKWANYSMRNPKLVYRYLFYISLAAFLLISLFPIYWLFVIALTSPDNMSNIWFLPRGFNIGVFIDIFQTTPFHWYVLNSLIIASVTTALVLLFASLAGYVFGRMEFRFRRPLMLAVLAISYFPAAAYLLPLFRLLTGNISVFGISSPDLFNTHIGIVIPLLGITMPLAIFILTTFYGQIPDGLEDAARIEGTTRLGALFRVIMPLSAPGVATAGVLTFITVYNEFFFSFLMNDGEVSNGAPLVWGMLRFQERFQVNYGEMAAASLVATIPIVILVIFAQERIVSGLTSGALKE
ncbi:carbohydrate ABC transporter permease [Haloarcula laminariae]|uniref:carbohydrate ABC transporter permease n=1 Tax=Haloarcula laminariae TaxID=2961577 RepID=UPI0021C7935D|nr:carbohydrate ABC transporter permease [Halomicroarcula laminariae]